MLRLFQAQTAWFRSAEFPRTPLEDAEYRQVKLALLGYKRRCAGATDPDAVRALRVLVDNPVTLRALVMMAW